MSVTFQLWKKEGNCGRAVQAQEMTREQISRDILSADDVHSLCSIIRKTCRSRQLKSSKRRSSKNRSESSFTGTSVPLSTTTTTTTTSSHTSTFHSSTPSIVTQSKPTQRDKRKVSLPDEDDTAKASMETESAVKAEKSSLQKKTKEKRGAKRQKPSRKSREVVDTADEVSDIESEVISLGILDRSISRHRVFDLERRTDSSDMPNLLKKLCSTGQDDAESTDSSLVLGPCLQSHGSRNKACRKESENCYSEAKIFNSSSPRTPELSRNQHEQIFHSSSSLSQMCTGSRSNSSRESLSEVQFMLFHEGERISLTKEPKMDLIGRSRLSKRRTEKFVQQLQTKYSTKVKSRKQSDKKQLQTKQSTKVKSGKQNNKKEKTNVIVVERPLKIPQISLANPPDYWAAQEREQLQMLEGVELSSNTDFLQDRIYILRGATEASKTKEGTLSTKRLSSPVHHQGEELNAKDGSVPEVFCRGGRVSFLQNSTRKIEHAVYYSEKRSDELMSTAVDSFSDLADHSSRASKSDTVNPDSCKDRNERLKSEAVESIRHSSENGKLRVLSGERSSGFTVDRVCVSRNGSAGRTDGISRCALFPAELRTDNLNIAHSPFHGFPEEMVDKPPTVTLDKLSADSVHHLAIPEHQELLDEILGVDKIAEFHCESVGELHPDLTAIPEVHDVVQLNCRLHPNITSREEDDEKWKSPMTDTFGTSTENSSAGKTKETEDKGGERNAKWREDSSCNQKTNDSLNAESIIRVSGTGDLDEDTDSNNAHFRCSELCSVSPVLPRCSELCSVSPVPPRCSELCSVSPVPPRCSELCSVSPVPPRCSELCSVSPVLPRCSELCSVSPVPPRCSELCSVSPVPPRCSELCSVSPVPPRCSELCSVSPVPPISQDERSSDGDNDFKKVVVLSPLLVAPTTALASSSPSPQEDCRSNVSSSKLSSLTGKNTTNFTEAEERNSSSPMLTTLDIRINKSPEQTWLDKKLQNGESEMLYLEDIVKPSAPLPTLEATQLGISHCKSETASLPKGETTRDDLSDLHLNLKFTDDVNSKPSNEDLNTKFIFSNTLTTSCERVSADEKDKNVDTKAEKVAKTVIDGNHISPGQSVSSDAKSPNKDLDSGDVMRLLEDDAKVEKRKQEEDKSYGVTRQTTTMKPPVSRQKAVDASELISGTGRKIDDYSSDDDDGGDKNTVAKEISLDNVDAEMEPRPVRGSHSSSSESSILSQTAEAGDSKGRRRRRLGGKGQQRQDKDNTVVSLDLLDKEEKEQEDALKEKERREEIRQRQKEGQTLLQQRREELRRAEDDRRQQDLVEQQQRDEERKKREERRRLEAQRERREQEEEEESRRHAREAEMIHEQKLREERILEEQRQRETRWQAEQEAKETRRRQEREKENQTEIKAKEGNAKEKEDEQSEERKETEVGSATTRSTSSYSSSSSPTSPSSKTTSSSPTSPSSKTTSSSSTSTLSSSSSTSSGSTLKQSESQQDLRAQQEETVTEIEAKEDEEAQEKTDEVKEEEDEQLQERKEAEKGSATARSTSSSSSSQSSKTSSSSSSDTTFPENTLKQSESPQYFTPQQEETVTQTEAKEDEEAQEKKDEQLQERKKAEEGSATARSTSSSLPSSKKTLSSSSTSTLSSSSSGSTLNLSKSLTAHQKETVIITESHQAEVHDAPEAQKTADESKEEEFDQKEDPAVADFGASEAVEHRAEAMPDNGISDSSSSSSGSSSQRSENKDWDIDPPMPEEYDETEEDAFPSRSRELPAASSYDGEMSELLTSPDNVQLSNILLNKTQVQEVADRLAGADTVKIVSLCNTGLDDEDVQTLAEAMTFSPSEPVTLTLSQNSLTKNSMSHVLSILKAKPSIKMLCLQSNSIGDDGVQELAQGLQDLHIQARNSRRAAESNLDTMSIDSNRSSADLAQRYLLGELDLSDTCLSDEGAGHLAKLIAGNVYVDTLNLSHNTAITAEGGWNQIGEALAYNHCLRNLVLDGNKVGDEGTEQLAQGLRKNKMLRSLALQDAGIGVEGSKSIMDMLKRNTTILELKLSPGNSIPESEVEDIQNYIALNRSPFNM